MGLLQADQEHAHHCAGIFESPVTKEIQVVETLSGKGVITHKNARQISVLSYWIA
jgi:hypothetical protein